MELHASAPQCAAEVEPIVAELRRLVDPYFEIQWQPRAVLEKRRYDANGRITEDSWRGRWELIKPRDPFVTVSYRDYQHICFVTVPVPMGPGIQGMSDDGAYAPVGEWLVRHMQMADHFNRLGIEQMNERLDAMNDAQERAQAEAKRDIANQIGDRQFFQGTMEGGHSRFYPALVTLTK